MYHKKKWRGWDLNPHPRAYESPAPPLSYLAMLESPHRWCLYAVLALPGYILEELRMNQKTQTQGIIRILTQEDYLAEWVRRFLIDRKAQNLSPGTHGFYQKKLRLFLTYCDGQIITSISELTPTNLRQFLFYLEEKGHNPGGIHTFYRTLRTFLNWYEAEAEPEGWRNPIKKVKAPKVELEPIQPVELDTVSAMVKTCDHESFTGTRDKAILFALLDTGARAAELLAFNLDDIDLGDGAILIRQGKGRKSRTVFIGKTTRKAIRAYLRRREDSGTALWVTREGGRLTYDGLRAILTRRAALAGVECPSLHDFRRAFALNMLRAGVDVYSLQNLMGHADLQVLRRYLAQTTEDSAQAHRMGSPVDNSRL